MRGTHPECAEFRSKLGRSRPNTSISGPNRALSVRSRPKFRIRNDFGQFGSCLGQIGRGRRKQAQPDSEETRPTSPELAMAPSRGTK